MAVCRCACLHPMDEAEAYRKVETRGPGREPSLGATMKSGFGQIWTWIAALQRECPAPEARFMAEGHALYLSRSSDLDLCALGGIKDRGRLRPRLADGCRPLSCRASRHSAY